MALAKVSNFSKWLLQIGDGASPEVFAAPCGLTSRGLQMQASTNDQVIPDCADEDAAAWVGRAIESLSGTVSGSGVMDRDALATYRAWFLSAAPRTVRMKLDETALNGGGYFEGSFYLTGLTVSGERGQKVTAEIEMQSDGAIAWVAAS